MGNMHKICAFILILALLPTFSAQAIETHTRDEVRETYAKCAAYEMGSPYESAPSVAGEYDAGALTQTAQESALAYVNFMRYVAYLNADVRLDPLYTLRAQHGAVLLAANDDLSHDAPCPADMPGEFYETAHTGTMSSNIACINWMEDSILLSAVEFFVRDDGEANLDTLGHRRWLLDPRMAYTGFGLANSQSGLTYAVMYAHDASNEASGWGSVAWPSAGAFPAELMSKGLAWSITLEAGAYDMDASDIRVSVSEKTRGKAELEHMRIDLSGYGAGPCVIFAPDLDGMGIEDYQQNQEWTVAVSGLVTKDGEKAEICYTVDMISLYPIDPTAVEMDVDEAELSRGETLVISAEVIPQWADDVSVVWLSTDESVAVVENGEVTAVGEGKCNIIARAVNGRECACAVIVK